MNTQPEHRRLSAIMFTDIVGYTSLTESDEAEAVRVRDRHRRLIATLVEQFEGELVESPGDESLSMFPSALTAVDCALAIQGILRDDAKLRLRIGIHIGDVLRRGDELIGEGVNLAARLRPLAEPGGICVSDAVWRLVASRPHLSAHPLGATALKNVSEAIEAYAIESGGQSKRKAPRRRRLLWAAGIAAALVALGCGLYVFERPTVLAGIALYAPKLFGASIEQRVGMTTTRDGVRIAYAVTGEGPPLVGVLGWATHLDDGLGSPLYDAEGLLPMTSAQHRFVRYDGRGFGLSDRDVDGFSLEARLRDLEAVVEAVGLERFAIYAQSAGGMVGIAYTVRHPDRVTKLVLASTSASVTWLEGESRSRFFRMLDLIEQDWSSASGLFVEYLLGQEGDEVGKRIFGEFIRRSAEGPQVAGFFREHLAIDVRELASQVRVPTLVIHGRDDVTVPLEGGRELAALIPGARFEIVDGDHRTGTGNAASSRAKILEFLAED